MGVIWRSAMPLLTTLAALVLIVHTAEEDLENEYRHDLRPRILDTRTPSYDQSWRVMEAEPILQPAQNEDWENKSQEELPKRRRPGRKRKRRPQTASMENTGPRERYPYPDEPSRPYFDVTPNNAHPTTEMAGKRRKKPDTRPLRWTDESVEFDRPLRRRSQRRKRPLLEPWPELSEFSGFRPEDTLHEEIGDLATVKQINNNNDHDDKDHFAEFKNERKITQKGIVDQEHRKDDSKQSFLGLFDDEDDEFQYRQDQSVKEDKSLSEFSSEGIVVHKQNVDDIRDKYRDKSSVLNGNEKAVENDPADPLTLKDILKRSNGTSLSEILQQHNLSLTDLLHGQEKAVSILKYRTTVDSQNAKMVPQTTTDNFSKVKQELKPEIIKKDSEEKELLNSETKYGADLDTTTIKEYLTTTEDTDKVTIKDAISTTTTAKPMEDNIPRIVTKRRYPPGARKKLRIRPMLNNTFKAQLSRDLITLNSRKYSHHRRNMTKFKEWKDVIPRIILNNTTNENNILSEAETTTIFTTPAETTTNFEAENDTDIQIGMQPNHQNKLDDINMDMPEITTLSTPNTPVEVPKNLTDRPSVVSMPRPTAISSGLRRQAFNNRLKRKRMKQRNSTTEPPQDDIIKNLFGMDDLVSSSEFIARTQQPGKTDEDSQEYTTLDDFMTTERTKVESGVGNRKSSTVRTYTTPTYITTTEETAKIEIEEILNDTKTSAKLSQILMERNMTLSELVEHRERGSSHVHLADIFHNASREPNPPEPFLSKSLIEPISKETYPLRALLDANLHDPTAKATTLDPSMIQTSNINIPVVMDFRNNVNENAENMGIMSLFNNFTKVNRHSLKKDSEGRPYETSITAVNTTHTPIEGNTTRESRTFSESIDDIVSWNEIFSLMRKKQKNETGGIDHIEDPDLETKEETPFKKNTLDEDIAGDEVNRLEDQPHLKDFDNNISSDSDEKLLAKILETTTVTPELESSILEKIPRQTKSVTVATASIAGLAMILFLLTYALFKWREQRNNISKKNSFCDEIPSPVFENRKGHKNNGSMRSISPMLQTSNIYTLNTMDSKAGKESPDYMWDTLRKPYHF